MTAHSLRRAAVAAAAGSAILYFLIGLGVLEVGRSTSGENDIMGFGLTVGTVFVVAAGLVQWVRRRWVLLSVGLVDAAVIAGYVALAGVRDPSFEPNGLLIKGLQVLMLAAIVGLLFRRDRPVVHAHRQNVLTAGGSSS